MRKGSPKHGRLEKTPFKFFPSGRKKTGGGEGDCKKGGGDGGRGDYFHKRESLGGGLGKGKITNAQEKRRNGKYPKGDEELRVMKGY